MVPCQDTVRRPFTTPKLTDVPLMVPVTAPPGRQGVPVMATVPTSWLPAWVQSTRERALERVAVAGPPAGPVRMPSAVGLGTGVGSGGW